jgi:hypothetical protein
MGTSMKKSRAQNRPHRKSTPSVICLPPPKSPASLPRKELGVERAMRLPQLAEPLVTDRPEDGATEDYATRQMRRRARRAQAKATRRCPANVRAATSEAEQVAPVVTVAEPLLETAVKALCESCAPALAEPAAAAPLPNNRGLSKRRDGLLKRFFDGWLDRRPAKLMRRDPDVLAEQMLILRTEQALVQSRLDRIIAASSL